MILLGLKLQQAGLAFLSVSARHLPDGAIRIEEIVCATAEDVARIRSWAREAGYELQTRVATPEEIAEHDAIVW